VCPDVPADVLTAYASSRVAAIPPHLRHGEAAIAQIVEAAFDVGCTVTSAP